MQQTYPIARLSLNFQNKVPHKKLLKGNEYIGQ